MRNARVLRVASTRDVCIFCATRQLAAERLNATFISSPALPQRRYLNSSSKAPQYASETQIYKEEAAPARPLTMAEKQRQQLLAKAPQQPQASHYPMATRTNAELKAHFPMRSQPPRQQQPIPARQPLPNRQAVQDRQWTNRGGIFDGPGRNQSEDRYAPIGKIRKLGQDPQRTGTAPRTNRYNINMDSRPPVADTPQFASVGHLKRRHDPEARRTPFMNTGEPLQPRRVESIRRLKSQEELDELLGNDSNAARRQVARPYARLAKDTEMRTKCFHCGSEDHRSVDCLKKPIVRQPLHIPQQPQQTAGSLSEAAQEWVRKEGSQMKETQRAEQAYYNTEERRRKVDVSDRRRERFRMDEDTSATETREPERRQRGNVDRRARGRVVRDEEHEDDRYVNKAERKRQRKEAKKAAQLAKAEPTPVYLPEYISVANLASVLKLRVEDFVRKLEELGFEEVQNDHILNAEHAGLIAQEYNFEPIVQREEEDGDLYPAVALSPEDYAKLPTRPPVVTIMGHVDHGKTTILDYMRSSSVAASEFGGITQHIGAFSVPLKSGKKITFLDTPGHAAFETMRARGANVTDIVVLVVAADDSVMPQTVEAIKHAQAAKVPMIVAINKIDKQQADPDAVKLDLGRHGIEVEDFGGEVQTVCVSGKTGQGIPDLEEAISTLSEILDHRANPEANVEGWVLEGTTKKSGKVATVLVRNGTLRQGDILVAGTTWTRVRSLRNEAGVIVKEVGPGMPVEVDGWREQPIAGDEALQATDEQQASAVSELRTEKIERQQLAKDIEAINESRRLESERREAEEAAAKAAAAGEALPEEQVKQESGPEIVSFIVKGDVSGSVEAVIDSISSIGNGEVGTRILRHGVGSPSEFDVQHAADASGHIVNFNTAIPNHISALAAEKGVKILDSNIIYRVVENVKALLSEKLGPKITQRVVGEAEVAAVFDISLGGRKKMKVAGSKVRNGVISNHSKARVLRNDETVFEGPVSSLKNQKKDVDQMRKDTECGIAFEGWEDFKVGDRIQCLEEKSEKRTL